jgi:hypothetical protein
MPRGKGKNKRRVQTTKKQRDQAKFLKQRKAAGVPGKSDVH